MVLGHVGLNGVYVQKHVVVEIGYVQDIVTIHCHHVKPPKKILHMFTELFDTQKSLKYSSSSIFIVNIFFNNASISILY
jgi:hypothetical protein